MKKQMNSNVFLIIIGVVVCLASILFFKSNQGTFEKTDAVITRIEEYREGGNGDYTHDVYVDYTVNGVEYKDIMLDTYSAGMDVGDTITVEYDVDNNARIRSGATKFAPYIMLVAGSAFWVFGVINLINGKKVKNTDPFA